MILTTFIRLCQPIVSLTWGNASVLLSLLLMANTQHWLMGLLWEQYWVEEGSVLLLDRFNTVSSLVWSNLCKNIDQINRSKLLSLYLVYFGPLPVITQHCYMNSWDPFSTVCLNSPWTSRRAVLEMIPASFFAETVYQPASSFRAGWMIIQR